MDSVWGCVFVAEFQTSDAMKAGTSNDPSSWQWRLAKSKRKVKGESSALRVAVLCDTRYLNQRTPHRVAVSQEDQCDSGWRCLW